MSTKHSEGGSIWCVAIFSLSVGMFHSASRQKNKVEQVNVDKTFQGFGLFSPSLLCVSGVAASPCHPKHLHLCRAAVPSQVSSAIAALSTVTRHFECRLKENLIKLPGGIKALPSPNRPPKGACRGQNLKSDAKKLQNPNTSVSAGQTTIPIKVNEFSRTKTH